MGGGTGDFASKFDPPLTIVTTAADGRRAGCLVGYWTECSLSPARFLVCISKVNHTFEVAADAESIALHLIPRDSVEIARLFGSETGDDIDKFAHCEWIPGPRGVPILTSCPTHAVCDILDRFDVGDHVALLVEPVSFVIGPEEEVFTEKMALGQQLEPGHPA